MRTGDFWGALPVIGRILYFGIPSMVPQQFPSGLYTQYRFGRWLGNGR